MKKLTLFLILSLFCMRISSSGIDHQPTESKSLFVVFLFQWKENVKHPQVSVIFDLWYGLSEKVQRFECFESNELETGEYDHVVILKFNSKDTHTSYLVHKGHQKITELGPELIAGFSTYSYWK